MFMRLSKLAGEGRTHNAIDRVYFLWTPLLLSTIIASLLIYWSLGKPIACWGPAGIKGFYHQHAESTCWTTAKVYTVTPVSGHRVDLFKPMPHRLHLFLPFVLGLMAAVSILPKWAWSIYIAASDVKLDNLPAVFRHPQFTDHDRKSGNHQDRDSTRINRSKFRFLYECVTSVVLPRHDAMLVVAYVTMKVLNLCAVNAQMGILDAFLSPDSADRLWTTDIFHNLHNIGRSSIIDSGVSVGHGNNTIKYRENTVLPHPESQLLPTMIFCDFPVRTMSTRSKKYIAQCSMNVNYYSRVIIAFVSTWLLFVRIAAIADLVVWVFRLLVAAGGTVLSFLYERKTIRTDDIEGIVLQEYTQTQS